MLTDIFFEEGHDALPGVLGCLLIVMAALVVEERLLGTGVDFDVVGNGVLFQEGVEFLALGRGEVFARVRADDRAHTGHGCEGAWVRSVEGCDGLEAIIGTGPGNGEAATHAETDSAKTLFIHAWLRG